MTTHGQEKSSRGDTTLFAQLEQYPWDGDEEFQSGLAAILGSSSSPEQAAELTLRARCFYFTRKFNTPVDFDAYKQYRVETNLSAPHGVSNTSSASILNPSEVSASIPSPPVSSEDAPSTTSQPQYPTSFAQIVELIQTGKPIPGIKDIPPTVLEGQGTESSKARRKKPWEKDEASATETTTSS